jgi:hypothetical protein
MGRISPVEALRIMMTRMAPPRGAQRLTEATHDWKCHIWRDGKLVPREEVGHLSVLESYYGESGELHPGVGDDRWDAVQGKYEFDADEVRALLPRANPRSSEPRADEEPPPQRDSPKYRKIRQKAQELYPQGYAHEKTNELIDQVYKALGKDAPKSRYVGERALGRRDRKRKR